MTVWSCWGGAASARSIRHKRKILSGRIFSRIREGCGKDAPLVEAALHHDIPAVGAGNGPGQAESQAYDRDEHLTMKI